MFLSHHHSSHLHPRTDGSSLPDSTAPQSPTPQLDRASKVRRRSRTLRRDPSVAVVDKNASPDAGFLRRRLRFRLHRATVPSCCLPSCRRRQVRSPSLIQSFHLSTDVIRVIRSMWSSDEFFDLIRVHLNKVAPRCTCQSARCRQGSALTRDRCIPPSSSPAGTERSPMRASLSAYSCTVFFCIVFSQKKFHVPFLP